MTLYVNDMCKLSNTSGHILVANIKESNYQEKATMSSEE